MAAKDAAEPGEQHLAILVPQALYADTVRATAAGIPAAGSAVDVDRPVVVMTVREAKGLEFDSVILVEPDQIAAESARGLNDLYVAITRATQRLGVLYSGLRPAFADPAAEPAAGLW
jgi:superfamily I DNA/RNA helicase